MPQDLFTIKRTAEFLSANYVGAKINKVFQPTSEEVNLLLFKERACRLVISTNAKFARVSVIQGEKPNPEVAFNFCMLLRKYITGAEITNIQIFNDDRVVKISMVNKNDLQDFVEYALYAEIMGKYSNLFFTKNGVILGALKQSAESLDGKRITLTGAKYTPPIKLEKLSAYDDKAVDVFLNYQGGALDRYILNSFNDFSPVTACEIASRIENANEKGGENAYKIFKDFINLPTLPTVIDDGVKKDFYATDYLSIEGNRTYFSNILDAIESVYSSAENGAYLKGLKSGVQNALNAYEKRLVKRLTTLKERIISSGDFEKYRKYGELLTSQIYLCKRGQSSVTISNYYDGGEITLELDETLSPQQNAQKYFKQYRKKKSAVEISAEQVKSAEEELKYLSLVNFYLSRAENKQDIEDIKQELTLAGIIKVNQGAKNKKQSKAPRFLKYEVDGFSILVGKNNIQNDKLLSFSDKNDLWLHVKNYHSSHVIIREEGREIPENVIKVSAEICAYFSQGAKGDKINVDYTKRRYVKKQGGKNLGAVTYENYSTIIVNPDKHENFIIK